MKISNNKEIYAIHFDLDTNKLKSYFGETNFRNCYKALEKSFYEYDFIHKQGSGYISKYPMTIGKVHSSVASILSNAPLIASAIKEFDIDTYIPKESLGAVIQNYLDNKQEKELNNDKLYTDLLKIFEDGNLTKATKFNNKDKDLEL